MRIHDAYIIILVLLGAMFLLAASQHHKSGKAITEKVDTVYIRDTVRLPVARDSVRVRTVLRRLRSVDTVRATDTITTVQRESVMVEVPIMQKHYEGEGYSAWVSGYEPRLDSIALRHRTIIQTKTVKNDKRWGFGVNIGYGFGRYGKPAPHVGIGLSYRIIAF